MIIFLNTAGCEDDEILCSTGPGQNDQSCISVAKQCDGIDDCLDGSDEICSKYFSFLCPRSKRGRGN